MSLYLHYQEVNAVVKSPLALIVTLAEQCLVHSIPCVNRDRGYILKRELCAKATMHLAILRGLQVRHTASEMQRRRISANLMRKSYRNDEAPGQTSEEDQI